MRLERTGMGLADLKTVEVIGKGAVCGYGQHFCDENVEDVEGRSGSLVMPFLHPIRYAMR